MGNTGRDILFHIINNVQKAGENLESVRLIHNYIQFIGDKHSVNICTCIFVSRQHISKYKSDGVLTAAKEYV